jgi:hypothetical protein
MQVIHVIYATMFIVNRGHGQGVWTEKCRCKHYTNNKAELVVYATLFIGHHKSSG